MCLCSLNFITKSSLFLVILWDVRSRFIFTMMLVLCQFIQRCYEQPSSIIFLCISPTVKVLYRVIKSVATHSWWVRIIKHIYLLKLLKEFPLWAFSIPNFQERLQYLPMLANRKAYSRYFKDSFWYFCCSEMTSGNKICIHHGFYRVTELIEWISYVYMMGVYWNDLQAVAQLNQQCWLWLGSPGIQKLFSPLGSMLHVSTGLQ